MLHIIWSCLWNSPKVCHTYPKYLGPVVQSVVCLTSSLRVISLTVLVGFIHNFLIFFAEKNASSFCNAKATHIFFSKKFQHICVSLDANFNKSLTNDVVSFEQLGPGLITSYHIWTSHFTTCQCAYKLLTEGQTCRFFISVRVSFMAQSTLFRSCWANQLTYWYFFLGRLSLLCG